MPEDLKRKALYESSLRKKIFGNETQVKVLKEAYIDCLLDYYNDIKRIKDEYITKTSPQDKDLRAIETEYNREVIALQLLLNDLPKPL